MRWGIPAVVLSIAVIVSLDVILLLAAAGEDLSVPSGSFEISILILDISVIASSLILGIGFAHRRNWLWAAPFLMNLIAMGVAAGLRAGGHDIRPAILFGVDLYWLHLYLFLLIRRGRQILERPV